MIQDVLLTVFSLWKNIFLIVKLEYISPLSIDTAKVYMQTCVKNFAAVIPFWFEALLVFDLFCCSLCICALEFFACVGHILADMYFAGPITHCRKKNLLVKYVTVIAAYPTVKMYSFIQFKNENFFLKMSFVCFFFIKYMDTRKKFSTVYAFYGTNWKKIFFSFVCFFVDQSAKKKKLHWLDFYLTVAVLLTVPVGYVCSFPCIDFAFTWLLMYFLL